MSTRPKIAALGWHRLENGIRIGKSRAATCRSSRLPNHSSPSSLADAVRHFVAKVVPATFAIAPQSPTASYRRRHRLVQLSREPLQRRQVYGWRTLPPPVHFAPPPLLGSLPRLLGSLPRLFARPPPWPALKRLLHRQVYVGSMLPMPSHFEPPPLLARVIF